uniref:Cordon-bleu WH2 repeat protein like 1 n=1 Tax=Pelusios castaneus TaxID=367368 RepID=A0A8C8SDQ7_9SAUR
MDQKENITDKDIQLSVVLPGDVVKSTTINGSKPMMDLLIFLCAQYHLNPSSYTIELMSAEKSQIKFKPNTPIGMLEVEKVILKPKHMDKKKPTPIIPEQTVRVIVNYKRTQKTVVRVSPHEPLQDLTSIICSKCEFDPLQTVLLKNYQSQEPLDVTKSLNDLGLRELYAMDVSRAAATTDLNLSSLQESCQISQNLDTLKGKENKGFFSFFQRSKKKREQTASAPATPLMNKSRPTFIIKSNPVSKQYDSNTLPSEMPKKRRAPLPPMPASQSVPHDLAHIQVRPTACVMKSSSLDENEQGQSRQGIVRTGSLQLSSTSAVNSLLRRTKRKAPSPPSRKGQDQSDNSKRTASESAESIPVHSIVEERDTEVLSPAGNKADITRAAVPSCASDCSDSASPEQNTPLQLTDETNVLRNSGWPDASEIPSKLNAAGICSEHSLEEISEKEEKNIQPKEESESADTSFRTQVSASFISTDVPLEIEKNDSAASSSIPGSSSVDKSQSSKEEKQENMSTDGKGAHNKIDSKQVTFENDKKLGMLDPNKNDDHSGTRFFPAAIGVKENQFKMGEIDTADVRENNKIEDDKLSNCQEYKKDIGTNKDDTSQENLGIQDQKLNQTNTEIVKTQDAAIQTTPSDNSFGRTTLSETIVLQDCDASTMKGVAHMQNSNLDNPPLQLMQKVQEHVEVQTEFNNQRQEAVDDKAIPIQDHSNIYVNDSGFASSERATKSPLSSPIKGYPLYRQDSKPKPKPSNEITREYIPKIGITTYKIVPLKSLEILKGGESATMPDTKDQDGVSLQMSPQFENSKECGMQTENLHVSRNTSQSESGLKYEPPLAMNGQLHRTSSITYGVPTSELRVTTESKQIETEASKLKIGNGISPLMLNSGNTVSSPETQEKSNVLSPTMKPSFYLQMQRRASGHYVTSAIARSVSAASSPTQSEATNTETGKKLTTPDQSLFPLHKTVNSPAQLNEEKVDDEKKNDLSTSVKTAKPLSVPSSQSATMNLKTLRTFLVPKPYSSSRPSPFALAVSSAVKRSQSFNKPHTISSQPSREESPVELTSATSTEDVKNHFLQPLTEGSQCSMMDKKSNCANSEQKSQVQSSADHPPFLFERGTALTFQSSDPELIHQSLLAAIRSGDAAAKLKRVSFHHHINNNGFTVLISKLLN